MIRALLTQALTLFGADVAAPGFLSFGLVASSSVWTMLDMMDLAGMMEGYEVCVCVCGGRQLGMDCAQLDFWKA